MKDYTNVRINFDRCTFSCYETFEWLQIRLYGETLRNLQMNNSKWRKSQKTKVSFVSPNFYNEFFNVQLPGNSTQM